MLAVPIGIVGSLLLTTVRGLENDVYFQVGLLATVGLAAKNGILIVEFAKELEEQGKSLIAATLEAARLRLRPILLTSLSSILGVQIGIATGRARGVPYGKILVESGPLNQTKKDADNINDGILRHT